MNTLSNKFLSFSSNQKGVDTNDQADGEKGEENAPKKKKKGGKANLLAMTTTDYYVDDETLYMPRIPTNKRLEYWARLNQNKEPRELVIPSSYKSWIKKEIAVFESKWSQYPSRLVYALAIIRSNRWDQWFLNFFLLWLLMVIFILDGWASKYSPVPLTIEEGIVLLPLVAMLLCQAVPLIGTIYFTHYCNDLVQYSASENILHWAFVSALVAQYVEYFHYGGRDRLDAAGRCAYGQEDHPPNHAVYTWVKSRVQSAIRALRARFRTHAPIAAEKEAEEKKKKNDVESDSSAQKRALATSTSAAVSAESLVELPPQDEESTVGALLPGDRLDGVDAGAGASSSAEEEAIDAKTEFCEWTCTVCKRENRQPRHPEIVSDLVYGTRGQHFKRPTVAIKPRRDMPACTKCFTYMDYKPPPATRHLFNDPEAQFEAFHNYPAVPRVQSALKSDPWSRRWATLRSTLFGLQEDSRSALLFNDWKLRKYMEDQFPEMFRVTLRADESYRIGELVECLHQKSVWTRGRVVNIRTNNTFDIKYDAGDEVRFVYPNKVRLLAEKKPFAYHVEIAMVALVVSFPLCLLLCVTVSPGLLGLSLLLVSVALLTRHVTLVVQYAINYSKAGLCPQLLLSLPISLPLLLLLVAAASTVSAGAAVPWTSVAALFAVAKFLSLPALAMMRKTYAVMGLGLFVLSSLAVIMAALLASGALTWPYSGAIAVAPSIILTCVLKYLRVHLHLIWDVCLVIRPARDVSYTNVSLLARIRSFVKKGAS